MTPPLDLKAAQARLLDLLDDDGESTYGTRPEDDPFFVAGQALDKLQG